MLHVLHVFVNTQPWTPNVTNDDVRNFPDSWNEIIISKRNIPHSIYIHGSVRRNSILVRCNSVKVFIYCKIFSTCFGCPSHPSSGVHKTVHAASGTATTFPQRGLIRPRCRKVFAQILWPVPEAALTVLCSPDDACDRPPKHVEWFCSK